MCSSLSKIPASIGLVCEPVVGPADALGLESVVDLAGRLARNLMKPSAWPDAPLPICECVSAHQQVGLLSALLRLCPDSPSQILVRGMTQQSRSRNKLVHYPFLCLHQRDKPSRGYIEPLPSLARQPPATNERPRRNPFQPRFLSCKPVRGCIEPLRSPGRLPCDTSAKLRRYPSRRLRRSSTRFRA